MKTVLSQNYVFKEIADRELDIQQAAAGHFRYPTIEGSSKFHAMVFTLNSTTFKASNILCMCDQCEGEYGSCVNFPECQLFAQPLNKGYLRSTNQDEIDDDDEVDVNANDFIYPGSVVVVPAEERSDDTVYFVKVSGTARQEVSTDDNGNEIPPNVNYFTGNFLERAYYNKNNQVFRVSEKNTFFYKENAVYPN